MVHRAIDQMLGRVEMGKSDSDYTYFSDLLLLAEALGKTVVAGMLTAITNGTDRHRYRIEHGLVRANGLGDWALAIEDILTGSSSQFLLTEAYSEQAQLTKLCKSGDWQYESVLTMHASLRFMGIECEDIPPKSDMKR